jgi:hypothetical protein
VAQLAGRAQVLTFGDSRARRCFWPGLNGNRGTGGAGGTPAGADGRFRSISPAATTCATRWPPPPARWPRRARWPRSPRGLEAFEPVKGRSRALAVQARPRTLTLVDDTYNANPDSVRAAIDVLAELPGPRLLVLGDMGEVGDQGPAFHAEVGDYARERASKSCSRWASRRRPRHEGPALRRRRRAERRVLQALPHVGRACWSRARAS